MENEILTTGYRQLLKKSIHVYEKQHRAISQNVANSNTDDYKRINTDFSKELHSAIEKSGVRVNHAKHIAHSKWNENNPSAGNENPEGRVDLAREMTDLSVNQIRFELVTRSLARHYSGISTAIVGRNR